MPLAGGARIGPFEIVAPLGAGGMGEVYRARDTKLDREVALKVLPESFANDPDRMTRFEREAKVLASLNHPRIAAIYGVEERALVMELIEGPTLAERISRGRLPSEDALPIARQIAEALEYAHDKGVVHRDLKPANVKVTPEGEVKLLDFGLAKALESGASSSAANPANSPTLTLTATHAGMILGTAGYMSPEQAKGKQVDRRADIWSFGVVLYEMLVGRQLYAGETVAETLAAVLTKDPDLGALPAGTPSPIRKLLARCLDKDSRRHPRVVMRTAPRYRRGAHRHRGDAERRPGSACRAACLETPIPAASGAHGVGVGSGWSNGLGPFSRNDSANAAHPLHRERTPESPDGQRFLVNTRGEDAESSAPIQMIVNWSAGEK